MALRRKCYYLARDYDIFRKSHKRLGEVGSWILDQLAYRDLIDLVRINHTERQTREGGYDRLCRTIRISAETRACLDEAQRVGWQMLLDLAACGEAREPPKQIQEVVMLSAEE